MKPPASTRSPTKASAMRRIGASAVSRLCCTRVVQTSSASPGTGAAVTAAVSQPSAAEGASAAPRKAALAATR